MVNTVEVQRSKGEGWSFMDLGGVVVKEESIGGN